MIDPRALSSQIASACDLQELELTPSLGNELVADIPATRLPCVLETLRQMPEWRHLSAITGLARDGTIYLLYHCWMGKGVALRVATQDGVAVPSLSSQLPGATWYEKEIHELLGVTFDGLAESPPLLLSEGWDSPPPLAQKDDKAK